jgi:hypothetical protein
MPVVTYGVEKVHGQRQIIVLKQQQRYLINTYYRNNQRNENKKLKIGENIRIYVGK